MTATKTRKSTKSKAKAKAKTAQDATPEVAVASAEAPLPAPPKVDYSKDMRVIHKLVDHPQPLLKQKMRAIREKRWQFYESGMTLSHAFQNTPDGNGKNAIDELRWLEKHGALEILPEGTDVAKLPKPKAAPKAQVSDGKSKSIADAEKKAASGKSKK